MLQVNLPIAFSQLQILMRCLKPNYGFFCDTIFFAFVRMCMVVACPFPSFHSYIIVHSCIGFLSIQCALTESKPKIRVQFVSSTRLQVQDYSVCFLCYKFCYPSHKSRNRFVLPGFLVVTPCLHILSCNFMTVVMHNIIQHFESSVVKLPIFPN